MDMKNSSYGSDGRVGPTRRQFLQGSAVAGLGAAAGMTGATGLIKPARAALEGPVNAFTWGGRVIKDEMADFLAETGVHVNFIGASGNSENLAKIKLGGGAQYDIVGVDALWVPKFYQEGVIEAIDMESWPSYGERLNHVKHMTIWM